METRNTTLHCHECGSDFTAELDMNINGNHEIECPNCGHIHYRIVEDGRVTGERYRSSMPTYTANTHIGTGTSSTTNDSVFLYQSWSDTVSGASSLQTSGSGAWNVRR